MTLTRAEYYGLDDASHRQMLADEYRGVPRRVAAQPDYEPWAMLDEDAEDEPIERDED